MLPNLGLAWYWAAIVGDGRDLVCVIDNEVPLPRVGLEVRSEGLWADHNLETSFEHWSLGAEAFAIRADDPNDALGELWGERIPFGLDLEWESESALLRLGEGEYVLGCRVTGEVLIDQERLEVDGYGARSHGWGPMDISNPNRVLWNVRLNDEFRAGVAGLSNGMTRQPIHQAPVGVQLTSGERFKLSRSLCAYSDGDGVAGFGWHSQVI